MPVLAVAARWSAGRRTARVAGTADAGFANHKYNTVSTTTHQVWVQTVYYCVQVVYEVFALQHQSFLFYIMLNFHFKVLHIYYNQLNSLEIYHCQKM